MNILKSTLGMAVLVACAMGFAPPANAQVSVDIHLGRPSPRHIWVGGYWNEGPRRTYVRSHWEEPPFERARWHQGRWYHPDEHWQEQRTPRGPARGAPRGNDRGNDRGPGKGNNGKGRGPGKD